jgi:hypothetical protein
MPDWASAKEKRLKPPPGLVPKDLGSFAIYLPIC